MEIESTGIHSYANTSGGAKFVARRSRWAVLCVCAFFLALSASPLSAQATGADKVRISGNSDIAFGTVTSFVSDYLRSQSVCLFAKAPPSDTYRITATGSGNGGSFSLSSGTDTLPYEVQWSASSGQTSGTQLVPNVPLTGLSNSAQNDDCSRGPATTASLIVTIRRFAIASAMAGSYHGSLSLLVAPE